MCWYAYAYSYYAYMGISIYECLNVHTGTGNSCPDLDEHQFFHDHFMMNMYNDEYLKKNQILDMTICIPCTIRVRIWNFWYIQATLVYTDLTGESHWGQYQDQVRWKCQNWLNTYTKLVWKYSIQCLEWVLEIASNPWQVSIWVSELITTIRKKSETQFWYIIVVIK